MSRSLLIGAAAGLLVAGFVGWQGYRSVYAGPRDALRKTLEDTRTQTEAMDDELARRGREKSELDALSAGVLGGSQDLAEHAMREGLLELGRRAGLADVLVTTGTMRRMTSPYLEARRGTSNSVRRLLRDRSDFSVLSATLTATGDWAQTLNALALLESQPWIARQPSLRLEPTDDTRTRFELRVTVEALHAADLAREDGVPTVVGASEDSLAQASRLAGMDLFRVPPPPPPPPPPPKEEPKPVPVVQAPPPPPPPPPYDRWRVTAVIDGSRGVEVIVTNLDGRGSRALAVGEKVLGATLVGAAAERAAFEIDGSAYEVALGMTLAQRTPRGG